MVKRFFIALAIVFAFLVTPLAAYADVVVGPEAFIVDNLPVLIIIILVAIVVVVTVLLVKLYRKKQGKK